MEHLINQNVKSIQISGIRRFFNMISGIEDMISLTIGQPDFQTPQHIKEAAKEAIDEGFTNYTHNAGFPGLREAAALYLKNKYDLTYNLNEVIITNGASQAIDAALRTILSPGDEVILPGPVYPGYEPIITLCNATPIYADTRNTKFKLTKQILEESITAKTKCIILPYPSNPTGVSLTEEELGEIANFIRDKNIFILADEIYSELTFDRQHTSIAKLLRKQTIVINGLSKSHSMTGWRIGILSAPEELLQHILKVHQYNVSCASSISQKAAYAALTKGADDGVKMKKTYKQRRDYAYRRLLGMGFKVVNPDGAFYFFVKIPESIKKDSLTFALELAQSHKVGVVPGNAFSPLGEGYIRISYACSKELLEEGLNRIESYLNNF
ncbi:aminotransferase [Bacillus pakistanensis]|uniref:Aminotransferase n=1 Tax=Rossellomorea pakistanensis TaxID=992288 RepID=A0ABS2NFN2_9BACI|nr:aminotransferase A [Bacillus pakistanensis]MBM7586630.1 aminotransferase [Bacillus pakistanensis]